MPPPPNMAPPTKDSGVFPEHVVVLRSCAPPTPFDEPIADSRLVVWSRSEVCDFVRERCGKAKYWTRLADDLNAADVDGATLAARTGSVHELQDFSEACGHRLSPHQAMAFRRKLNQQLSKPTVPSECAEYPAVVRQQPRGGAGGGSGGGGGGGGGGAQLARYARELSEAVSELAVHVNFPAELFSYLSPTLPVDSRNTHTGRLQRVADVVVALNVLASIATYFSAALSALLPPDTATTDNGPTDVNAKALLQTLADWVPAMLKQGVTKAEWDVVHDFLEDLGKSTVDNEDAGGDGNGLAEAKRVDHARRLVHNYNAVTSLSCTPSLCAFVVRAAEDTVGIRRIIHALIDDLATTERDSVDATLAGQLQLDCRTQQHASDSALAAELAAKHQLECHAQQHSNERTRADEITAMTAKLSKRVVAHFAEGRDVRTVKQVAQTILEPAGMRVVNFVFVVAPPEVFLSFSMSNTAEADGNWPVTEMHFVSPPTSTQLPLCATDLDDSCNVLTKDKPYWCVGIRDELLHP